MWRRGEGRGASPGQFVIYAARLINLIFLCVNLHHEPLSFIRGERCDREKRETRKERAREKEGGGTERCQNYLVLIKLLLPDADVRGRKDYAVAD